ncbi:MAG: ATP-binding protein [Myxococcota bacterium]
MDEPYEIPSVVAVFLHNPISTPGDVLRLLRDRVPEGLHLDYKAAWSGSRPDRQEEAGKDVAAFANTEGGDIIVGIQEDPPGQPSGFSPRPGDLDDSQIRAWLNNVVVPRDVVASVRIRLITVNDGTAEHRVLVVSVPPWPDGIVGVRTTKAGNPVKGRTTNDRISFLFPFRDEDESRFREFDEVLMALNTTNRRAYLRLRHLLQDGPTAPVHLVSSVVEALGHGSTPVALGQHAEVHDLRADVVVIKMTCTWSVVRHAAAWDRARGVMQVRHMNTGQAPTDYDVYRAAEEIDVEEAEVLGQEFVGHLRHLREDQLLVVPLSQVDEAWLSAGVLNMLLKVNLSLTKGGWCLTTRYGDR